MFTYMEETNTKSRSTAPKKNEQQKQRLNENHMYSGYRGTVQLKRIKEFVDGEGLPLTRVQDYVNAGKPDIYEATVVPEENAIEDEDEPELKANKLSNVLAPVNAQVGNYVSKVLSTRARDIVPGAVGLAPAMHDQRPSWRGGTADGWNKINEFQVVYEMGGVKAEVEYRPGSLGYMRHAKVGDQELITTQALSGRVETQGGKYVNVEAYHDFNSAKAGRVVRQGISEVQYKARVIDARKTKLPNELQQFEDPHGNLDSNTVGDAIYSGSKIAGDAIAMAVAEASRFEFLRGRIGNMQTATYLRVGANVITLGNLFTHFNDIVKHIRWAAMPLGTRPATPAGDVEAYDAEEHTEAVDIT